MMDAMLALKRADRLVADSAVTKDFQMALRRVESMVESWVEYLVALMGAMLVPMMAELTG